jgi:hypothetical protein
MGSVKRVFVIGDYAQGLDSGEIEVIIVGDNINTQYIKSLSEKIEKEIGRKVNFLVNQEYNSEGLILYNIEDETTK